jgi:hypothetical protein
VSTPEKPASSKSPLEPETPQRGVLDSLLGEVRKRVPAELPRSVEEGVRLGQRTLTSNLAWLQGQLDRRASQADVDRLTRRVDEVARQVQELVARQRAAAASRSARPEAEPGAPTGAAGRRRAAPSRRRRATGIDEQAGSTKAEVQDGEATRKRKKA